MEQISRRAHGDGSITKVGGNRYRIRYDGPATADGRRRQKSETFRGNKQDALRTLRERTRAIERREFVEPSKLTVASYLRTWLDRRTAELEATTIQSYRSIIDKYVEPNLGHLRLQTIEPTDIQANYDSLVERGLKCVPHVHRVIRKAFNDATKLGILHNNPLLRVTVPRERQRHRMAWSPKEVARFLEEARVSDLGDYFEFCILSGLRRSEVSGLKWSAVDIAQGKLGIVNSLKRVKGQGLVLGNPKTHRSQRSIRLSKRAVELLKQVRAKKAANELLAGSAYEDRNFVFSNAMGSPIDPDYATKQFRYLSKDLGLPDLSLHGLRNTHASLLIKSGAHVKVISARLGHSSTSFSMDVYGHLLPGVEEAAVEALDDVLASGG